MNDTPSAVREAWGRLPDGREAELITLRNGAFAAAILTYGARVQALIAPDRDGRTADVALGFSSLDAYLADTSYMGATVGRVANRIAGGRFTLDGQEYRIPPNNGPNALHGGPAGFDKTPWEVVALEDGPAPSVALRHHSPDGDAGFPGALTATAVYALGADGTLAVTYEATADAPTLVNLSNHAYWNLGGEGSAEGAMGQRLHVPADAYLPTDATAIPTGVFAPVDGTPFDFRAPTPVGARVRDASDGQIVIGRGYDHHWAVAREPADAPRLLARVEEPRSGRRLEVHSDQPGLQIYSGNFLDGTVPGKAGRLYRQGDALVLEPQMPPDTPNQPAFGSIRLKPGETYRNRILFRFGTDAAR